jgi:uncharacterized membrane protein
MQPAEIGLALAYWLHLLATVAWIGALVTLSVLVLPAAQQLLDGQTFSALIGRIRRRLQPLSWFSLLLLGATGMFQMSAHPAYEGFLAIHNSWAVAILTKHIMIGFMVLVNLYLTWGVLPAIQRTALLRATGKSVDGAQVERLMKKEASLLRLNLVLSVVVLALTAWARAAG